MRIISLTNRSKRGGVVAKANAIAVRRPGGQAIHCRGWAAVAGVGVDRFKRMELGYLLGAGLRAIKLSAREIAEAVVVGVRAG